MIVFWEMILNFFLSSDNSFEPAASSITFTCYNNKKPTLQWTDSWRGELPSGLQGWKSGFTACPQSQSGVNRSHVCILNFSYITSLSLFLEIKMKWIERDVCENLKIWMCRLFVRLVADYQCIRANYFSQVTLKHNCGFSVFFFLNRANVCSSYKCKHRDVDCTTPICVPVCLIIPIDKLYIQHYTKINFLVRPM